MTGLIELKLSELNQLFNSMDPSPFHDRDLDRDAEEFIVSWAAEHPRQHDLKLVVHLAKAPADVARPALVVSDAISHYFDYRATMTRHELKRLLREGRAAFFVGLVFLALCLFGANALADTTGWRAIAGEGLLIVGWVAMWKPLEIALYLWWPLVSQGRLYRRLARMPVEVIVAEA
ncbi:MAG: hypothetical protein JNJ70_18340 [Verrucomicrobiales bacterium]|nr:hypothetical protein [Verrucomicrobiales bacterium]